jgi:hypothetical protein
MQIMPDSGREKKAIDVQQYLGKLGNIEVTILLHLGNIFFKHPNWTPLEHLCKLF